MNRFFDWADAQIIDLAVMLKAFASGFAKGMRG